MLARVATRKNRYNRSNYNNNGGQRSRQRGYTSWGQRNTYTSAAAFPKAKRPISQAAGLVLAGGALLFGYNMVRNS